MRWRRLTRTLRKRQIRCRRFSRPFTRPTIRVHVLRLRGRQRRVQRGSRGRQWPWRSYSHVEVFSRESVCRVAASTGNGRRAGVYRASCALLWYS